MYPETDVPPVHISTKYVESLHKRLPELPEQKLHRLTQELGLNEKLAKQIIGSEYGPVFDATVRESPVSPTLVAVVLTETLKALRRDRVAVENVSDEQLLEMFRMVGSEQIAKEAAPEVIVWLASHEGATVEQALKALGLGRISQDELENIIDELIEDNRQLLKERKGKAFGVLMGLAMNKVRGRTKAEVVSELVKRKLGSMRD